MESENLNRRGCAARTPHRGLDEAESLETKRTKKLTFRKWATDQN
jgi:hypothetical protein